jgi:hypothetical protein
MPQLTREMMNHPLIQELIQAEMLGSIDSAILVRLMRSTLTVPAVYPKDRPFKICECRHFVNYCSHIWQTDSRNIKFELRRSK